jgi:xanthine dioxygenase
MGLAIESEIKELVLSEVPPWTEDKVKVFPMVRAPFGASCPVNLTNLLSALADVEEPDDWHTAFPGIYCVVQELLIDPLPEGASRDRAIYADGARLTDLKEVRDLLYKMQRPAIAPNVRSSF